MRCSEERGKHETVEIQNTVQLNCTQNQGQEKVTLIDY